MPLPIMLAHKLCMGLSCARRDGVLDYLRPDGKSQVTVEYADGVPVRVDAIVVSSQHSALVDKETLRDGILEKVIRPVVPAGMIDEKTKIYVNPTGRFVVGGPQGDAGVTGRKIIVDTYGGAAPHGGGAFSGKDPTKVDRSACYMARYIAKNCVAAGLADRLLVQLAYAIGVADPVSVMVETYGTGRIPDGAHHRPGASPLQADARAASWRSSTCGVRSTGRRPRSVTSAAPIPTSPGSGRTAPQRCRATPGCSPGAPLQGIRRCGMESGCSLRSSPRPTQGGGHPGGRARHETRAHGRRGDRRGGARRDVAAPAARPVQRARPGLGAARHRGPRRLPRPHHAVPMGPARSTRSPLPPPARD